MLLRIWGQQKNVHDELYAMFILIETFTDSSSVMDLHKNKKFKETLSFACSHSCWLDTTVLILFRLGFFGAAHGCPPPPKISNSSNFSWVFKSCFNKHGHILMMLAKKAAPSLLKRKIFWKKGYYVIFSAFDITSPILSRDSNYNVNVVMWPKSSNSSTSVREAIIASIL